MKPEASWFDSRGHRNLSGSAMSLGLSQRLTEMSRVQLKRAEAGFHLSAKRTSPFKSARTSVQSTTGSRDVRISGSNAGCIMFRGSVKGTGYPLHSPVSPSHPVPCATVCHHISTGPYILTENTTKIFLTLSRMPAAKI